VSQTNKRDSLQWIGFLTVVICLALVILMAFAMFTTERPGYRLDDSYGPPGSMQQFQENAGTALNRAVDRTVGEVL